MYIYIYIDCRERYKCNVLPDTLCFSCNASIHNR